LDTLGRVIEGVENHDKPIEAEPDWKSLMEEPLTIEIYLNERF
jgi:hypothetical protein